ncbi:FAD-dependent monooxygenase [Streptosporangiaceae bacterium NEAU-GS5]|nr:FAD-dependent monooxygenase [Streptosporangiaceae bacterium NEAU-GS5]
MRILIIGGGIGGLCLAQGLKKQGVEDVAVFERDESAAFRGQGYRISLKEDGTRALRACLPQELFELTAATAIKTVSRMLFMDDRLRPKFDKPVPGGFDDTAFGVNRLTLREILLTGLDDMVGFGRVFESYAVRPDGRVEARFADGGVEVGDLLVGADGTNSAVRRQLLPDAALDDLGGFIYGRTPMPAPWLPAELDDTFNRMTAPDGTAMSVVTCRAREPYEQAVARLAPHARLTPVPDYLAWMVTPAGGVPSGDGETLRAHALNVLEGWPATVRRVVAEADAAATFPVRLRSALPVDPWHEPAVTLMGDAIHTMSPGRGEGANVTLRDARELRDAITGGDKAYYEYEMLQYGFAAVKASREQPFMRR